VLLRVGLATDGFDTWSADRDRRYERSRSATYVSRQMVGYADLDEYVAQKALDGLYLMVAEEEKKIRKDPVSAGSAIVRKVFGVLSNSR